MIETAGERRRDRGREIKHTTEEVIRSDYLLCLSLAAESFSAAAPCLRCG